MISKQVRPMCHYKHEKMVCDFWKYGADFLFINYFAQISHGHANWILRELMDFIGNKTIPLTNIYR